MSNDPREWQETPKSPVAGTLAYVRGLFKYANSFMAAETNSLDVLICDEKQRKLETSANRYTRADLRSDKAQVSELIDAARVPVFLLDEHQVVRPGETGTGISSGLTRNNPG